MKTKLLALTMLFGFSTVTGGAGDEDVKKELDRLQGSWKLVYEEEAGKKIPVKANEVFIFKGSWVDNKVGEAIIDDFRVEVFPKKSPKEMDLSPKGSKPCPAIYKLEGNKLTICVNFTPRGKRPAAFETNATNRYFLLILEKVEPKGK